MVTDHSETTIEAAQEKLKQDDLCGAVTLLARPGSTAPDLTDASTCRQWLIDELGDRQYWAATVIDSAGWAALQRALELLDPGAAAARQATFATLLEADYRAAMHLKNADRAIRVGNTFIACAIPDDWRLFNLATLCQTHGRRKEAAHFYHYLASQRGVSAEAALVNGSFLLWGAGRFDEVASLYEKLGEKNVNYATALSRARRYTESAAIFITAFEATEKSLADYFTVVEGLLSCGEVNKALAILRSSPQEIRAVPKIQHLIALYDYLARRLAEIRDHPTEPKQDSSGQMGVLGILACWGADYIETFLDIVLPSLLDPKNLPALARRKPMTLRIATDLAGRMQFRRAPGIAELQQHITVEYEILPLEMLQFPAVDPGINARYRVFGALWHLAAIDAAATGRDVCMVYSDIIYASGSWDYASELVEAGAEVVMSTAFSARWEAIRPRFDHYVDQDGHLSIGPRELMDEAFRCLHPRSLGGFVTPDNQYATHNCMYLFFPTAEGLTHRVLQTSPLYLKHSALKVDAVFDFLTNDGEFIDRLLPEESDWKRIVHITDNDRHCALELSRTSKNTGEGEPRIFTADTVASHADAYGHFRFMRKMFEVEYHFRGTRPPPWGAADTTAFVDRLGRLLKGQ